MSSPCGWVITKCGCGSCWNTYGPEVQATASTLAIGVMWMATARRYGLCPIVVQPCQRPPQQSQYQTYPVDRDMYAGGPYISGGQWYNSCDSSEDSGCCGGCGIDLDGPTTTTGVTKVTVAGVVVPPAAYLVLDGYHLVRTDGQCWPTCVNHSNQSPPDFEIEYLKGEAIPPHVQTATERLACEWAKACTGGTCALPARLRSLSRQGVEAVVETLSAKPGEIRTGVPEVDMVITLENPTGRAMRPVVWSPDATSPRLVS